LLTVGVLIANLGVAIGLAIEHGMIKREIVIVSRTTRKGVVFLIVLAFSAIWLAASGAFMYVGVVSRSSPWNWMVALLLALLGTFVLVPLKMVIPKVGSGVCVGVVFNAVAYLFLVIYRDSPVYVPWGIMPILLFESVLLVSGRALGFQRAVLLSSLLTGTLFGTVYYPFTTYFFSWSFLLQPLIFSPIAGSIIGALLGVRVYTGLSSVVLGDMAAS
jgi:hypothetical protein